MKYTKKHTEENALNSHCKAIEERNGYFVIKNCKGGWILTYWFDDIDFKMIDVTMFNRMIKNKLKQIISDNENNNSKINEHIATLFFRKIIDVLGSNQTEMYLRNSAKNPTNHFQFQEEIGNIVLWAAFIYINDNHEVDDSRCNIEILNSDYDSIKIIYKH